MYNGYNYVTSPLNYIKVCTGNKLLMHTPSPPSLKNIKKKPGMHRSLHCESPSCMPRKHQLISSDKKWIAIAQGGVEKTLTVRGTGQLSEMMNMRCVLWC